MTGVQTCALPIYALGCAVATEIVQTIRDEGLIQRSNKVGHIFKQKLVELQRQHECIREVRGLGLMLALEVQNIELSAIHRELFSRGYLVGISPVANLLRFFPPLTISIEDIDGMIYALNDVLSGL